MYSLPSKACDFLFRKKNLTKFVEISNLYQTICFTTILFLVSRWVFLRVRSNFGRKLVNATQKFENDFQNKIMAVSHLVHTQWLCLFVSFITWKMFFLWYQNSRFSKKVVYSKVFSGPEATEKIYRSQHNIYKGQFYQFFLPWLKTGLLTSTGAKWKDRRRLLTPAFHKHVLEDYLETMNEKADIMIKNIKTKMKTNKSIEIQKFVTLCALDIIVETAMGAMSNLQSAGDNDYVNAIYSGKLSKYI